MRCDQAFTSDLKYQSTPDELKRAERVKAIEQTLLENSERGKLIRLALKLRPEVGGSLKNDIRAWVLNKTGVDLNNPHDSLRDGDIAELEREVERADRVLRELPKLASWAEAHGTLKKWHYLPQDLFRKDILGGRDLWLETSVEDARRNAKLEAVRGRIEELRGRLEKISGVKTKNSSVRMQRLEDALGAAKTKRQMIERSLARNEKKFSNEDLAAAKQEEERADASYRLYRSGDSPDKATALYNDIANALMGKYGSYKNAMQVISKRWANEAKSREVADLIEQSVGFLDHYRELAVDAVTVARENLAIELQYNHGMREGEAKQLAEHLYEWKEEEYYYPRRSLMNATQAESVAKRIRNARSHDEVRNLIAAHRSRHTKARKWEEHGDISRNVPDVLQAYAEELVFMHYANRVGKVVNTWVKDMRTAQQKVRVRDFHAYADAAIKEVLSYADQMVYAKEAGIADNAVKTLVSMKAMQTMGFLNFSTPALNYAEGHLHAMMRFGLHRWRRVEKEKERNRGVLDQLLGDEYVKMTSAEMLGEHPRAGSYKHLRGLFSDDELRRFFEIDASTADRWTERMADFSSKAAADTPLLGLQMQRAAENSNRRYSFEAGAVDELEYAISRFKPYFVKGDLPEWIARQHDIDIGRLKQAGKAGDSYREQAWQKFLKDRVTRSGYEFMYATQWQYNQAARHMLEHWRPGDVPVGKALMMFQHYPLSWISAYRMAIENTAVVWKNGGFKSLWSRSTRDETLGLGMSQQALYHASVGSTHLVMQAMRFAAPFILGQLFTHPIYDLAADGIAYATADSDEDRKKVNYGRGVMNQFLGPFYSDFTDHFMPALGVGINRYLFDTGELPEYMQEVGRLVTGVDWSKATLKEQEQLGAMRSTAKAVTDVFLWDAVSSKPKWLQTARDLQRMDYPRFAQDLARHVGIRPNWSAITRQDRDERM